MPPPPLGPFRPGRRVTNADLDQLARAVVDEGRGASPFGARTGFDKYGGGGLPLDANTPGHWARITGGGAGGLYTHRAVAERTDGGWDDLPMTADFPFSTDVANMPAIEATRRATVPTDGSVIAWLEFDSVYPGWRFAFAFGGFAVCGTPMQRKLTQPADAACRPCDVTDADVERYEHVTGVAFDKCGFRVTATNQCGGSGADAANAAASGSGPTDAPAVLIETQGFTGVRPVPWDIVFCPFPCAILIQWSYDCYYKGLYLGYYVGPPVSCDGGSGGSGAGPGGA